MSNLKKYFTKEQVMTIPNMMSFLRLVLIPFIVVFYLKGNVAVSVVLVVISGLTDFFDGRVARRFNQISDLGKMLDPVADKLTMGAIIIALSTRYSLMIPFIIIFIICEITKALAGVYVIRRIGKVSGAIMPGKVCTFGMYIFFGILFLFPNINMKVANIFIWISMALVVYALAMYLVYYYKLLHKDDKGQ